MQHTLSSSFRSSPGYERNRQKVPLRTEISPNPLYSIENHLNQNVALLEHADMNDALEDDKNPSLIYGNYKCIYSREIPIELKLKAKNATVAELGTMEIFSVKIYTSTYSMSSTQSCGILPSSQEETFWSRPLCKEKYHDNQNNKFSSNCIDKLDSNNDTVVKTESTDGEYSSPRSDSNDGYKTRQVSNIIKKIKVEVTSENDLFFLYIHEVDDQAFNAMQQDQGLTLNFEDYPKALTSMFDSCLHSPSKYMVSFILLSDGEGCIEFTRNLEYKVVKALSLDLFRADDALVIQHVTYRYNSIKAQMAFLRCRLGDISNVVKQKYPSLLLQLQKIPTVFVNPLQTKPLYPHKGAIQSKRMQEKFSSKANSTSFSTANKNLKNDFKTNVTSSPDLKEISRSPITSYIKGDKIRNFDASPRNFTSKKNHQLYNDQNDKELIFQGNSTTTKNTTIVSPKYSSSFSTESLEKKQNHSNFQSQEFILRKKISVVRPTVNSVNEAFIPGGI